MRIGSLFLFALGALSACGESAADLDAAAHDSGDVGARDSGEVRDATGDGALSDAVGDIVNNDVEVPAPALKAFPTAFGAGAETTGGRGGRVIHVTNLDDSGPGSLREAVMATGPRIVVFDVSGSIELRSNLNILDGDLTIAGQTAPEGGITLVGRYIVWSNNEFNPNVRNIIVRYLRVRPDFVRNGIDMCIQLNNVTDVVLDHLSLSWGGDKAVSISDVATNVTVQNSLIGESNTGMLLGLSLMPYDDPAREHRSHTLSAIRNVFYDSGHRFPNVYGKGRVDVINNVGYNYRYRLTSVGGEVQLNAINNYYDRGTRTVSTDFMQKLSESPNASLDAIRIHSRGNMVRGFDPVDEWSMWTWFVSEAHDINSPVSTDFRREEAYEQLGAVVPVLPTATLLDALLTEVGTNRYISDSNEAVTSVDVVDERYLENMRARTYVEYEWNEDWESYAHYQAFHAALQNTPLNERPAGYDTDRDGMPNSWEEAHGHDPDVDDSAEDADDDGYTNIEEFLNVVDL